MVANKNKLLLFYKTNMTTNKIKKYIEQLIHTAYAAGKEIMEIYESDDLGIESKPDESPLTKADKAANEIICAGLAKITPNIPIISEENIEIPYSQRKDYEYLWMVDPLDGTKEFIKRNGEFTINIALIHNQKSIAGIVYTPVLDKMYYAIKGEGAYIIEDNEQVPLVANEFRITDDGLKIVCSRSHLNEATKAFVDNYTNPELITKGSSLKFLILAEGGAELYPRIAPTMEWDTAAAHIILTESGGRISQLDGTPLLYNKKNLLNPHFIATANERQS